MQGNSEVAKKMQEVADGLKSQGGSGSVDGSDYKVNAATKNGSGPDLSGYGGGK